MLRSVILALIIPLIPCAALATPTASFTARPIQGSTCLAPCAVHFDAIGEGSLSASPYVTAETTDPDFTREFHSLLFQWDFGDPSSGNWSTGARAQTSSPWPRNYDRGGIAGHLYTAAGSYTVTLTVTNPNGQSAQTTRNVTVTAPVSHFSGANTYCVAPDNSDWTGCPLATGSSCTDENCVETSDLDLALTAGDNCVSSDDCANLDAAQQWVLFRGGSTYSLSTNVTLNPNTAVNSATPTLIQSFGTGQATFDFNGNRIDPGSGETWHNLVAIDCGVNECWVSDHQSAERTNNLTYYDITCTAPTACINYWLQSGVDMGFHTLVAEVEIDNTQTSTGFGNWWAFDYGLILGGTYDRGSVGIDASIRTRHLQHVVHAHRDWINPADTYEHWQLRAWNAAGSGLSNKALAEANRFVLFQDNLTEEESGFALARVCNDSACNCYNGASGFCGHVVEVSDFIFDANFHYFVAGTNTKFNFWNVMCGGITIRNNVVDFQGGLGTGEMYAVYTGGNSIGQTSGNCNDDNVHVFNNTFFTDDTWSHDFYSALNNAAGGTRTGCGTNCLNRNNLVVWPNGAGGTFVTSDSAFTNSNNYETTTEPWPVAAPEIGATALDDFTIASPNASIISAGFNFSGVVDNWVHTDAMNLCREGTTWDIGAHEYGAAACAAGVGSSGGGSSTSGTYRVSLELP